METVLPYCEFLIQVRASPTPRAGCWIGHYEIRSRQAVVARFSLHPMAMPAIAVRSRALDHAMEFVDSMADDQRFIEPDPWS